MQTDKPNTNEVTPEFIKPETPPEVTEKPELPKGIVLTERQKVAQAIVTNVLGMVQTQWSVITFKNEPFPWMQYFCGLAMKMPTIIVMRKQDAQWIPVLKENKLVKAVFQVEDYKEPYNSHVADKIAHFIKQHPVK